MFFSVTRVPHDMLCSRCPKNIPQSQPFHFLNITH